MPPISSLPIVNCPNYSILLDQLFFRKIKQLTLPERKYEVIISNNIKIIRLLESYFFLLPSCYLWPHSMQQVYIMYCVQTIKDLTFTVVRPQRLAKIMYDDSKCWRFLYVFRRTNSLLSYNDRKSKWQCNYKSIARGPFNLPKTLLVSPCLYVLVVYYNVFGSFKFTVNCPSDFGFHNISVRVSLIGHIIQYNDLADYSRVSITKDCLLFPRVFVFNGYCRINRKY